MRRYGVAITSCQDLVVQRGHAPDATLPVLVAPPPPLREALSTNQHAPRGVREHRHRRRDRDGRVDPRQRKTSSAETAHVLI